MAGLAVTSRSGLGFAEYLKEQGKRVGRKDAGERKKNQRRNVWWGRREKKSIYIYLKLK
jgi:hypothetical protein